MKKNIGTAKGSEWVHCEEVLQVNTERVVNVNNNSNVYTFYELTSNYVSQKH